MSIEIIQCSVRWIETTKPDKKQSGKITLYLYNMTQQCAVAGLRRETNDGCFDAANANKSCVRVHGGQSSEFPIYPTTRERGKRHNKNCTAPQSLSISCSVQFVVILHKLFIDVGILYHYICNFHYSTICIPAIVIMWHRNHFYTQQFS